MSAGAEAFPGAQASEAAAALAPPLLRTARFEDHQAVNRLGFEYGFATPSVDEWRRLWLDNPLWPRLGTQWPIGWVLETQAGHVVGWVGNIPTLYTLGGHDLVAGNGHAWAALPEYRGYALWVIEEYLAQPGADLCIMTTAGPMSAGKFDRLSARIPLGDWETSSYWPTRAVGYARDALKARRVPLPGLLAYPAGAVFWLASAARGKPLSTAPLGVVVDSSDGFDDRFDAFWDELVRHRPDTLLAERTSAALSWHFARPLGRGRLWILTASKNGHMRGYCILKRSDRSAHLVDYQSLDDEVDLLPGFLRVALRRCVDEDIHTLENTGRGVPKMRAVDEAAPYRRKLSSWKFFYRASDAGLDQQLRDPRLWDPSVYDGNASLV